MNKTKNVIYVILGFIMLLIFGYVVFTAKQLGI